MYINHLHFFRKLVAMSLLLGFFVLPAQAQDIEKKIRKEIKKILKYEVEWKDKLTPGFKVVFIEPDTSFTIDFGTEIDSKESMPADRLFSIGGLSKVYCSVALGYVITQGHLDTSRIASEIFPSIYASENFTVLDLMRHTAGFPRVLKGLQVDRGNENENVSYDEFTQALEGNRLKEKEYVYNHNDYALLERWVTQETGKSIADWYREAMDRFPTLPPWREEFSPTEGLNNKGRKVDNFEYGVFTSSLGLYATAKELEQLTRFLLSNNEVSAFVRASRIETGIAKNIHFSNGLYRIGKSKKYTLYGHGGSSANNNASLHFVPETNTGVVILSNSQTGTNPLYLHLISMINQNWKR